MTLTSRCILILMFRTILFKYIFEIVVGRIILLTNYSELDPVFKYVFQDAIIINK